MVPDREASPSHYAPPGAKRLIRLLPDLRRLNSLSAFCARYRVILFFVVGLVAVDALVYSFRTVWQSYDPDDYVSRIEGCRGREWDVVLLGGSPVSEGIDPSLLEGVRWQGRELTSELTLGWRG